MDNEKSFIALIEKSIKKNWDLDALTDYKGATLQYKDLLVQRRRGRGVCLQQSFHCRGVLAHAQVGRPCR